jgi:hypothetical protein
MLMQTPQFVHFFLSITGLGITGVEKPKKKGDFWTRAACVTTDGGSLIDTSRGLSVMHEIVDRFEDIGEIVRDQENEDGGLMKVIDFEDYALFFRIEKLLRMQGRRYDPRAVLSYGKMPLEDEDYQKYQQDPGHRFLANAFMEIKGIEEFLGGKPKEILQDLEGYMKDLKSLVTEFERLLSGNWREGREKVYFYKRSFEDIKDKLDHGLDPITKPLSKLCGSIPRESSMSWRTESKVGGFSEFNKEYLEWWTDYIVEGELEYRHNNCSFYHRRNTKREYSPEGVKYFDKRFRRMKLKEDKGRPTYYPKPHAMDENTAGEILTKIPLGKYLRDLESQVELPRTSPS